MQQQWMIIPVRQMYEYNYLKTLNGSVMGVNMSADIWSSCRSCSATAPWHSIISGGGVISVCPSTWTGWKVFHFFTWSECTTCTYMLAAEGTTIQSGWNMQSPTTLTSDNSYWHEISFHLIINNNLECYFVQFHYKISITQCISQSI